MRRAGRVLWTLLVAAVLLGLFTQPSGAHYQPVTSPMTAPGASPEATPDPPAATHPPSWPALDVTALGDSVTAGTHCSCAPFPELYAADLHRRYATPVEVANDGVAGQASADVLDELREDKGVKADVAAADVVVVTIGANDFGSGYTAVTGGTCGGSDRLTCVRPALATLDKQLPSILARIAVLRDQRPTAVLVTGYWNVFEDGDVAADGMTTRGLQTSDQLTRAANAVIEAAAAAAGAHYVNLYTPFKGVSAEKDPTALLADDGDHPNAAGHRLIARTLLTAGLAPLQPH